MELRHLRYFVAVAEMENVSRAALKLHVSQPALSRQIRDLEDEVGVQLLEQTAKSVRVTDAGVSIASDVYGYSFGSRVKLLRLTPEPKPIVLSIAARKGKLSPAAEKFWECAKEAASPNLK